MKGMCVHLYSQMNWKGLKEVNSQFVVFVYQTRKVSITYQKLCVACYWGLTCIDYTSNCKLWRIIKIIMAACSGGMHAQRHAHTSCVHTNKLSHWAMHTHTQSTRIKFLVKVSWMSAFFSLARSTSARRNGEGWIYASVPMLCLAAYIALKSLDHFFPFVFFFRETS